MGKKINSNTHNWVWEGGRCRVSPLPGAFNGMWFLLRANPRLALEHHTKCIPTHVQWWNTSDLSQSKIA